MDIVLLATLLVIFDGFHVPSAGQPIEPGANLTEAQSASAERSHRLVKVTNRFEMERSKVDQVPGASHPPALTAQPRHNWHKYNFVRRIRKDVLAQADTSGSAFGQHSADKVHNSPIDQQPGGGSTFEQQLAEKRVNSSFTHPPTDAAGDPLTQQPANSGSSQLAIRADSSSFGQKLTGPGSSSIEQQLAQGGPSSTLGQQPVVEQPLVKEGDHSTTIQQPTNEASKTVSNSKLAKSNSALNHQVDNRQSLPLHSSSMHKPIAGTELQSIGVLSPAQGPTAGAQVANAPTTRHSDSAAISIQKASLVDQPLQLNPTLTSDLKAQEPATNQTEALPTSTHHSIRPADLREPPIAVFKEAVVQKSSNSQTIQLNAEPIILVGVPKGSSNQLTNDSKLPAEEHVLANGIPGGLIPPQLLPAAGHSVSSNQRQFVIWNPFAASNNSKASQNLASNSSHLTDNKNGSLGSNGPKSTDSSEKESASSDDDSSEFSDEIELKLVDTIRASSAGIPKNPPETHEPTTTGAALNISSSTASSFRTQIGDVLEATYEEANAEPIKALHTIPSADQVKNLTPTLANLLINADTLKPTLVNLSCSIQSFLPDEMLQKVTATHSSIPAGASAEIQHTLQNTKLPMVPQQSLRTTASVQDSVSYHPMILVPTWALMTRYPVHTMDQNAIEFSKHHGQASSNATSIKKLTKESGEQIPSSSEAYTKILSTSPAYHPHRHERVFELQHEQARGSHFIQFMAPTLFHVGESFTFLPSNKNAEKDSNEESHSH